MQDRDVPGDAGGDPKGWARLKGFLGDHVPFALVMAAVVTIVITVLIYPSTPAVTVQRAIQRITVVGPIDPSVLDVEEANVHGGVQVSVVLRSSQPQGDPSPERLVVAVSSSSSRGCPPQAIACPWSNGARTLTYRFGSQPWTNFGATAIQQYQYGVALTVKDMPGTSANLAQDSQDIATSLPPVSVLQYVYTPGQRAPPPTYPADPPEVDYGERVMNGSTYTWQDGTTPVETAGWAHWFYASASTAPDALSPTFHNGTDLSVQSRNTTLVFLAGILLGIAGGALVGALQVAITKTTD